MDSWRKWERGEMEKIMKHILVIENVGCNSNLIAIKGE